MMKKVRGLGKGFFILSALLLMFAVVGCDDSDSTEPRRGQIDVNPNDNEGANTDSDSVSVTGCVLDESIVISTKKDGVRVDPDEDAETYVTFRMDAGDTVDSPDCDGKTLDVTISARDSSYISVDGDKIRTIGSFVFNAEVDDDDVTDVDNEDLELWTEYTRIEGGTTYWSFWRNPAQTFNLYYRFEGQDWRSTEISDFFQYYFKDNNGEVYFDISALLNDMGIDLRSGEYALGFDAEPDDVEFSMDIEGFDDNCNASAEISVTGDDADEVSNVVFNAQIFELDNDGDYVFVGVEEGIEDGDNLDLDAGEYFIIGLFEYEYAGETFYSIPYEYVVSVEECETGSAGTVL